MVWRLSKICLDPEKKSDFVKSVLYKYAIVNHEAELKFIFRFCLFVGCMINEKTFLIISKIIFWGYYALLSPVRMDWNASSRAVNYYWAPIPLSGIITIILLLTILYVTGQKLFRLKEE